MFDDTIAAISTAWGEAGIAVVRVSGAEARVIADSVLLAIKPLSETPPRYMRNACLIDNNGQVLDKVLAVWFRGPKSFTGEDVAEIQCHGGALVARTCLEMCIARGARPAEPGEFTRRAFMNGRIDLTQAEAVLGIIRSKSEEALRASSRVLRGELAEYLQDVYHEILSLSARLEVGLDFPEEDIPFIDDHEASLNVLTLKKSLEDLLDRCRTGFLLRDGIRVALVGRPNVGKSSLLNALLQESRAIVTSIPGTTRDVIEEVLSYRGVPLTIVDTAGIGIPADEVEAIGIERAEQEFHRAEVRVWVIDGSEPLSRADLDLASRIQHLRHVVVINKADLPLQTKEKDLDKILPASPVFIISAQMGEGLEKLKDEIVSMVAGTGALDSGLNTSSRQIHELQTSLKALEEAWEALEKGLGQDISGTCLSEALESLERLLGIQADDTLLDTIFSQFCVGK